MGHKNSHQRGYEKGSCVWLHCTIANCNYSKLHRLRALSDQSYVIDKPQYKGLHLECRWSERIRRTVLYNTNFADCGKGWTAGSNRQMARSWPWEATSRAWRFSDFDLKNESARRALSLSIYFLAKVFGSWIWRSQVQVIVQQFQSGPYPDLFQMDPRLFLTFPWGTESLKQTQFR